MVSLQTITAELIDLPAADPSDAAGKGIIDNIEEALIS
jgi:hypothetical protein